jgi:hypothetical protein
MTHHLHRAFLASALIASTAPMSAAAQTTEDLLLPTSDPGGFHSIAIRHDRIVAGAPQAEFAGPEKGTAYLFDAATGQQLLRFDATDAEAFDWFGSSVALNDDVVLVGSPRHNEFAFMADTGAAYVFSTTTGQQLHDLTPADLGSGRRFGTSVSLSGDLAAIGAEGFAGAVYVFDVAAGQELRKLTASDGVNGDRLGGSVSISGALIAAGARYADSLAGAAYVFDANTGAELVKLLPADGAAGDTFGEAVAIDGDRVVVGAPRHDFNGEKSGAVYIFDAVTGNELMKLVASDGVAHDRFGSSVAIHGPTIVVGAPQADTVGNNAGVTYVFDLATGQELDKLVGNQSSAWESFGRAISIWGDSVAVASTSAGRVFHLDLTTSFCAPSSGNSVSSNGATLVSTGGFGTAQATFNVIGVPNSFGLLVAGTDPANVSLGCNTRCIGGSVIRGQVMMANANQVLDIPFDMALSGVTHVQFWYRDASGCSAGFDLSNALAQ